LKSAKRASILDLTASESAHALWTDNDVAASENSAIPLVALEKNVRSRL